MTARIYEFPSGNVRPVARRRLDVSDLENMIVADEAFDLDAWATVLARTDKMLTVVQGNDNSPVAYMPVQHSGSMAGAPMIAAVAHTLVLYSALEGLLDALDDYGRPMPPALEAAYQRGGQIVASIDIMIERLVEYMKSENPNAITGSDPFAGQ